MSIDADDRSRTWARPSRAVGSPPVHELVRACAARSPDAIAISGPSGELTYADLLDAVDAVRAEHESLPKSAVVAVLGPITTATVVRLLATFDTGQVILPIDASLPEERRRAMIHQSGAVAIHDPTSGKLTMIEASERAGAVAALGSANRHPAYVFFTSGSTGTPKAIVGSHHGLSQFLCWQRDTFRVGEHDRVAAVTGLSFDPVLRALFLPLVSGARLCLPDPAADPAAQVDWMRRVGSTIVHATPSQLRLWLSDGSGSALPDLRVTFTAGEPLTAAVVAAWTERALSSRVVNLYGPTETTLARCWFDVPRSGVSDPIPVGHAIPGSVVEVLDANGNPCPVGVAGDVWIQTWFGTLGYLDAPADSGFRPDATRPDLTTYRTGDIGKIDGDGLLVLIGRSDDQVKVAGVRVEPGEVARTFEHHRDVATAVVLPYDDRGSVALGGFVVPRSTGTIDVAQLRRFIARTLPAAAIPGRIIVIDALPLTPNGKVDRQHLRALLTERTDADPSKLTGGEERMAAIWTEVLGRQIDGPKADFWDLGGSSLAALRVKSRLGGSTDFAGVLHHLLEHPTLRDFTSALSGRAEAIREPIREPTPEPIPEPAHQLVATIAPPSNSETHPLSPQQRQMWLLDSLGAGANYYAMQRIVITGTVDERALDAAFSAVIAAHDILRSRVRVDGDDPVVTYVDPHPFTVDVFDHPIGPDEDPMIFAERLGDEFRDEQSLSLEHGPVIQARLYRLRPGHQLLFAKIHHFCTDGYSMPPMWKAIGDVYADVVAGRPVQIPSPPRQYHEWASESRDAIESGQLDDAIAWWENQLCDAPILQLPGPPRRSGERRYEQKRLKIRFAESFKAQLRAAADDIGATRNQVLLALYALCLERLTGQDDLVIGMPANARTNESDKQVIGYFVNLLPLRIRLPDDRSLRSVARCVAEVANAATQRRNVPFETIVERLRPERRPGVPALAQTEFNYRQHFQSAPQLTGVETRYVTFGATGTAFDIAMHVSTAATPLVTLSWESAALSMSAARHALDEFEALTVAALADVDCDLRAVGAAEVSEPSERIGQRQLGYAAVQRGDVTVVGVIDANGVIQSNGLGELVVDASLPTGMLAVVAAGEARLLGPVAGVAELDGELVDIAELGRRIGAIDEITSAEVREIGGRLTAVVVPRSDDSERAHIARRIENVVGVELALIIVTDLPLVQPVAVSSAVPQ